MQTPSVIYNVNSIAPSGREAPIFTGSFRLLLSARHIGQSRPQLPPRVMELAALHGVNVPRVSVRDQKSRWGSCSRRGTISLNWQLIQTPGFVRDYQDEGRDPTIAPQNEFHLTLSAEK